MRNAAVKRKTNETDVEILLNIDGKGNGNIDSGCPFLDHMLTLFAHHGCFDLEVRCKGDTEVDFHHTVEDVGIALGEAFSQALGDKRGINRFGDTVLPMDEALILTAVDLSGRTYFSYFPGQLKDRVGSFDTELVSEFFWGFVRNCPCSLHIRKITGENTHHIIEGMFKSFARTMREAAALDLKKADVIPSTKGVI